MLYKDRLGTIEAFCPFSSSEGELMYCDKHCALCKSITYVAERKGETVYSCGLVMNGAGLYEVEYDGYIGVTE